MREFTIQNVNYIQISRDEISENEQFIVDEKFLFILEKGIQQGGTMGSTISPNKPKTNKICYRSS